MKNSKPDLKDIERILWFFDAKITGYAHRSNFRTPISMYNMHQDISYQTSYDTTSVECATITIPISNLSDMIEILTHKYHPTDNDYRSLIAKRELYDSDPYFKQLYDTINTYLQLRLG